MTGTGDQIRTILLIDTDIDFGQQVSTCLSADEFHITHVHSVSEAEIQITKKRPDLVLVDMNLLGEKSFCYLRRGTINPHIPPVIITTSDTQVSLAVQAFKLGAVDCLFKPVTKAQLTDSIELAFDKAEQKRATLDKTMVMSSETTNEISINGHVVKRVLGRGTMGIVYLVEKCSEDGSITEYAMKVMKPMPFQNSSDVETIKKRFNAEARAAYAIRHPNIVQAFDYGLCKDKQPYILMEYCPGKSLNELIAQQSLSLKQKCSVISQIAQGLEAIHAENMCHRDIKPANIIVNADMVAKITDFGLVKREDSNLTMTSDVFGTPSYLAPEAFRSAKVDFRADQFSFGSVAFELLTGAMAFPGDTVSIVAKRIIEDDVTWPVDGRIPEKLIPVIRRALSKDPAGRYPRTGQLVEALGHALQQSGVM